MCIGFKKKSGRYVDTSQPGVLMVTGAFPPEISGGGKQCATLIKALQSRVRFTVLTVSSDRTLPVFSREDTVCIHRVIVRPGYFFSQCAVAIRIVVFFCRYHVMFDIVQLHGVSGKNFLMVVMAKIFGKKVIQKMTSLGHDDPASLAGKKKLYYTAGFFDRSDIVISVSDALTQSYLGRGHRAGCLREINNGVDLERFCPVPDKTGRDAVRAKLGLPRDIFFIMHVGFFSRDKGADTLVKAWDIVRKEKGDSLGIIFVGARFSNYCEIDESLVREVSEITKGCGDRVYFIEKTLTIEDWLRAADCFVFPSLREGMPNALLEAMACALPCVVSLLPGITDTLIEDGRNGYLVPPADVRGFARRITAVLDDPYSARVLGECARKTIENNFDIRTVSAQYESLYCRLAAR